MTPRRDLRLVVAGQAFGALADSALLIVAIALLIAQQAAAWTTPALRIAFYLSYVVLGAVSGALADAFPKRSVLVATNLAKLAGCLLIAVHVHPVAAYALVGLGAAAHGPAKYGILSEVEGTSGLVAANAWIEVATVVSMLLGVALGSALVDERLLASFDVDMMTLAVAVLGTLYAAAAVCSALVTKRRASDPSALRHPLSLMRTFAHANAMLWRDGDAQVSLAVTCLFWAAAASLQFIVLRWGMEALHLTLSQATLLQGAVAVGMIAGAAAAGRWVPASRVLQVQPLGLALGVAVAAMALVTSTGIAAALLFAIGLVAGLLVVPMNALLQQRGAALLHPGQSISVQAFGENALSMAVLAVYGALVWLDVPVKACVAGLGVAVCCVVAAVMLRHRNQARPAATSPA